MFRVLSAQLAHETNTFSVKRTRLDDYRSRALHFGPAVRAAFEGTNTEIGEGSRETFVVVASKRPLDLAELGERDDDPRFFVKNRRSVARAYGPEDEREILENRSRGIILTDDYAPVENLLAPVAETRGRD